QPARVPVHFAPVQEAAPREWGPSVVLEQEVVGDRELLGQPGPLTVGRHERTARGDEIRGGVSAEPLAADGYLARARSDAGDGLDQLPLAAAFDTRDSDHLVLGDREADVSQQITVALDHADPAQLEHGLSGRQRL